MSCALILPSLGKPGFIASLFTLILYPLDIYVNKKTPFYLFFEKKIWIYFRLGERPFGGAGSSGGGGLLPGVSRMVWAAMIFSGQHW
jgi:hypothetical protein